MSKEIILAKPELAENIRRGDVVAVANGYSHWIGVVKGYGKTGALQVTYVNPYNFEKTIPRGHPNRVVIVDLGSLPRATQEKVKELLRQQNGI